MTQDQRSRVCAVFEREEAKLYAALEKIPAKDRRRETLEQSIAETNAIIAACQSGKTPDVHEKLVALGKRLEMSAAKTNNPALAEEAQEIIILAKELAPMTGTTDENLIDELLEGVTTLSEADTPVSEEIDPEVASLLAEIDPVEDAPAAAPTIVSAEPVSVEVKTEDKPAAPTIVSAEPVPEPVKEEALQAVADVKVEDTPAAPTIVSAEPVPEPVNEAPQAEPTIVPAEVKIEDKPAAPTIVSAEVAPEKVAAEPVKAEAAPATKPLTQEDPETEDDGVDRTTQWLDENMPSMNKVGRNRYGDGKEICLVSSRIVPRDQRLTTFTLGADVIEWARRANRPAKVVLFARSAKGGKVVIGDIAPLLKTDLVPAGKAAKVQVALWDDFGDTTNATAILSVDRGGEAVIPEICVIDETQAA